MTGETNSRHFENAADVLWRLRQYGLRAKTKSKIPSEEAEHVLDMQGPSKPVGNATAAEIPLPQTLISSIQKVLKPASPNISILLPSAFQLLQPARKTKEFNILKKDQKEVAGTKEIINPDREQSPLKRLSLICIPRGPFRAAPVEIGGN